MSSDLLAIRVLFEQLHALRAQTEGVDLNAANKPGLPGSGMSVLIKRFNSLLERAKSLLADAPVLSAAVADVGPVEQIIEGHAPAYHTIAKHEVLANTNMILQALAPLLMPGAAESSAVAIKREGLFLAGQHFDAMQFAWQILSQARKSIVIIDGYIDHKVLDLLTQKSETVTVAILTKPAIPGDIGALTAAFNRQYGQKGAISIRASDAFHDRFLIIDDTDFYHFGASFKDLGTRGSMFSRIEEQPVIDLLRKQFTYAWEHAVAVV